MGFTVDTFADCLKAGDTLILRSGRFVRVRKVTFPGDETVVVRTADGTFTYVWDSPVAVVASR